MEERKENIGRLVPHRELRTPREGVVRIIYQYRDGEVACLEGDNVTKFFADVDSVIGGVTFTRPYMIPQKFLDVTWRVLNSEEASTLLQQDPPSNPQRSLDTQ